jgi:hypothetical protein
MPISVTSAADRLTREEQITQLSRLVAADGAVKVRFPVQVYDEDRQQYTTLREAQWTLSINKADLTPRTIPQILEAFDLVMRRIGSHGADYVRECIAAQELGPQ